MILRAFDRQPNTAFKNTGTLSFDISKGTTAYTFMLDLPKDGSIRICQYDKRNYLMAEQTTDKPFFTINVTKKATRIELIGKADVYEVIAKEK